MPDFRWRPLPGRFGVSINESSWNNFGIATTVTASATTVMMMPMPPGKWAISKCSIATTTAAAGSAAITVQFFKRPAGTTGASDVALTNTFDLTQAATNKRVDIPLLATLTEAQRTFAGEIDFSTGATAGGDLLIVKWVAAGTVTSQPVLTIQAELFNLI